MTEEVEVKVHDVVENGKDASSTFVEGLRKLLLAGIGAVALSRDETESFVNKLVERGELAQKDAEKLLREVQSRLRKNTNGVEQQAEKVGTRVEQGMEDFLNRLNIPSKRDIDELSAKIAQLAVRIEELRKQK
ncbi:MAG TPA: phasin family protein [Kouleothrix sp.]|uniref:phasin family protein n=1 Tax=Kouleothrix sp. TaxID=2779161 RepID=UPI002CAF5038|nr:phasin family protein [Kouleothrix sp.]HRC75680.1 phasin family protein [Kouleothrix sp.]